MITDHDPYENCENAGAKVCAARFAGSFAKGKPIRRQIDSMVKPSTWEASDSELFVYDHYTRTHSLL